MSIGLGVTKIETVRGANLNQAADTVLLTYAANKPCRIQRYGAIGDSSNGIPSATRLKLRERNMSDGSVSDLSDVGTLNPGAALSQGQMVYKDAENRVYVDAGDEIILAIHTDAGGVSTANVWLEVEELPFVGSRIPDDAVKSA